MNFNALKLCDVRKLQVCKDVVMECVATDGLGCEHLSRAQALCVHLSSNSVNSKVEPCKISSGIERKSVSMHKEGL